MDDPIFTYGILKELVSSDIQIGIVVFLKNPSITAKRLFILFLVYGPKYFFEFAGAYLWWNIFKGGRVQNLFKSYGISCYSYGDEWLNKLEPLVEAYKPELILSVNCNERLPQSLLRMAKLGGINLHQGSLPLYKGLMPIFYSQLHGVNKVGSTIHIMNSKFDSGNILIQEEISIYPGENYVKIWKKLNQVGSKNLIRLLKFAKKSGELPSGVHQDEVGEYYSLPSIKLAVKYFLLQLKKSIFNGWSK